MLLKTWQDILTLAASLHLTTPTHESSSLLPLTCSLPLEVISHEWALSGKVRSFVPEPLKGVFNSSVVPTYKFR